METPELHDYREHLLDALDDQPRRATAERPELLQILVNHERVGTLDCAQSDPSFAFTVRERSIQQLEIRGESGVLIGGCVAPEAGPKDMRIPIGKGTATVQVRNHFDGGSLQFRYETAPRWWSHLTAAMRIPSGSSQPAAVSTSFWTAATACAQIVLALGVVALLAERVPSWIGSDDRAHQLEEELAARQSTQEQIDRMHQQLAQLREAQAAAVALSQSEQERITQLSTLVETVTHGQQKLNQQVAAVQDDLLAVKTDVGQEVENGLRVAVSAVESDRDSVRQDLQSIKSVNETLIKQVAMLESRNRELNARLALTSLEVAKANAAPKPTMVAKNDNVKDTAVPTTVADGLRESDRQAFMFWVAFQDGTTEKSIEDLVQELNGIKKGPMKSGWYSVEVNLPKPEPPDRFLESVKRAKIVKSVVTSKAMPPAQ
jgi:Tfp pilus assembly protein PilN